MRKTFSYLLFLAIFAITILVFNTFYTTLGLKWILGFVNQFEAVSVTANNLQGALMRDIRADELQINIDNLQIKVDAPVVKLLPGNLLLGKLSVENLVAAEILVESGDPTQSTETATQESTAPPTPPIPIDIKRLSINSLKLVLNETDVYNISNLETDGLEIQELVNIDYLSLEYLQSDLTLSGQLGLTQQSELDVKLSVSKKKSPTLPEIELACILKGTWHSFNATGNLLKPLAGKFSSVINTPFENFNWKFRFNSDHIKLAEFHTELNYVLKTFALESQGEINNFAISSNTKIFNPETGTWAFNYKIKRSMQQWQLQELTLASTNTSAKVTAHGSISGPILPSPQDLFTLRVNWHELNWPLNKNPRVRANIGDTTISGSLDQFTFNIESDLSVNDYSIDKIKASGDGNMKQLIFHTINATAFEGSWNGNGSLLWQPYLQWNTELKVKQANLAAFNPKLRGIVDAQLKHGGQFDNHLLTVNTSVLDFSGDIGKHSVKGKAEINLSGDNIFIHDVDFRSKTAALAGRFSISDMNNVPSINAKWHVSVENTEDFYKDLYGSLRSTGEVNGELQTLSVLADLQVKNMDYKGHRVGEIQADFNLDLGNQRTSKLKISAGKLEINSYGFNKLQIDGTGLIKRHKLDLFIQQDENQHLQLSGDGGYDNKNWLGQLSHGLLQSQNQQWQQLNTAYTQVSPNHFEIRDFCFILQNQPSKMCSLIVVNDYRSWRANIDLEKFQLGNFLPWFPQRFTQIAGLANVKLSAQYSPELLLKVSSEVRSGHGWMEYTSSLQQNQRIDYKNLVFSLDNIQKPPTANLVIDLVDTGHLISTLSLPAWDLMSVPGKEQQVKGTVDLHLSNLKHVPGFFPDIQKPQGEWHSIFKISGTFDDPMIEGTSELAAHKLTIPGVGIELKKLNLSARSKADRTIFFTGQTQSGDGVLKINGEIKDYRLSKMLGKLHILGEQFTAVKLPEATVNISPALLLLFNEDVIELEGTLTIPKADIQIFDVSGPLTVSSDVVFVGEEQQKAPQYLPAFRFQSDIDVVLGDKVWMHGYGFEGRLQGTLNVIENTQITTATGELHILDGKYSAYGKELVINKGKLVFSGGPIDNPGIQIQAIREINRDLLTGINIEGEAKKPKISLFSDPPMNETDILSYIVLGYPLSDASKQDGTDLSKAALSIGLFGGEKIAKDLAEKFGIDEVRVQTGQTTEQTSLVLGKYLSPKLYVNYAIGIGQTVNTLQLQYKLADKWLLKAESGEYHGADLIFTFEH